MAHERRACGQRLRTTEETFVVVVRCGQMNVNAVRDRARTRRPLKQWREQTKRPNSLVVRIEKLESRIGLRRAEQNRFERGVDESAFAFAADAPDAATGRATVAFDATVLLALELDRHGRRDLLRAD